MLVDKSLVKQVKDSKPKLPAVQPATAKDISSLSVMFSQLTDAVRAQSGMINNKLEDIKDEVTAKAKYQFFIKRNAENLIESITVVEK